jgi:hypothetical protein
MHVLGQRAALGIHFPPRPALDNLLLGDRSGGAITWTNPPWCELHKAQSREHSRTVRKQDDASSDQTENRPMPQHQ